MERIGPGLACAHFEHRIQPRTDFLIAIERTAVERAFPFGDVTRRLVKLKLEDAREEIAGVGGVARNVIFRACVKIGFAAFDRRFDPLILEAQVSPTLVIIGGGDFA